MECKTEEGGTAQAQLCEVAPSAETVDKPPTESIPPSTQQNAAEGLVGVVERGSQMVKQSQPGGTRQRTSSNSRPKNGSIKVTDENLHAIRKKLVSITPGRTYSATSLRGSVVPGDKPDRLKGQVIKYMNSYRLESKHPFHRESVYNIIRDVFQAEFKNATYDPLVFAKTCGTIACEIRARVKALGFDRYKLICVVQICEKNRQSVQSIAKFLWDPDRDSCTSYSYESTSFLASGAVFGLYYE